MRLSRLFKGLTGATAVATALTTFALIGPANAIDPYYPQFGNTGYDAIHYDLRLDVAVPPGSTTRAVAADCTMSAVATARLTEFSLDLAGLTVASVKVNGLSAAFAQNGAKLLVTPRRPIAEGQNFLVRVRYGGQPGNDGDGGGWTNTTDGGILIGVPFVAAYLLPVNDDPADKALFRTSITVPAGLTGVSNGVLRGVRQLPDGRSTWSWAETRPMVMHNIVLSVGVFEMISSRTKSGIKLWSFIDPSLPASQIAWARYAAAHMSDYLSFLESKFGRYPFPTSGMVVDNAYLGYAMEAQERPFYDPRWFRGDPTYVFIHELAHQWFAASVSPATYADTWLNEGFATYAEFLYGEFERKDGLGTWPDFDYYWSRTPENFPHGARSTAQQEYDNLWNPIVANPGADPSLLFSNAVYTRGAMTLHLLRETMGAASFMQLLKDWPAAHRYGIATTAQFEAFAQSRSARDLSALFRDWLHTSGKPTRIDYSH